MRYISDTISCLRSLILDRRGSTFVVFALSIIPLIGFVGVGIDYSRLVHMKIILQAAADTAAISGASANYGTSTQTSSTADDPYDVAVNFFANAWLPPNINLTKNITAPTSSSTIGATVTATATAQVAMSFLSIWKPSVPVTATAVAVVGAPSSANYVFPFVFSQCVFNSYWSTQAEVSIESAYHSGDCAVGMWTSFTANSNSDSITRGYEQNGCGCSLSDGTNVWIQTGTKTDLYTAAQNLIGQTVLVPIVNDLTPGQTTPIVSFAAFQIDNAVGGSAKQITGHFIDNYTSSNLSGTTMGGTYDGVYTVSLIN